LNAAGRHLAAMQTWSAAPTANAHLAVARLYAVPAVAHVAPDAGQTADAAYAAAAALAPEKAEIYDEWGVFLMGRGAFDAARERFRQAVARFDNKNQWAYHAYRTHLAASHYYLGDYAAAVEVLDNAFHPGDFAFDSVEARFIAASAYLESGETETARGHIEAGLRLDPDDPRLTQLLEATDQPGFN
jgi:Tfp pilus assembly protein PilF